MSDRPSICYAAPGHALHGTSGSARNMLSLANALSRWAEVTLVFRSIREPFCCHDFKVVAIEPDAAGDCDRKDDVAAAGLNVFAHTSYLRKLNRFCRQHASSFDVVFEKGWRLSGFLAAACARQSVPAVLVENDVRHWSESVRNVRSMAKYCAHQTAQKVAGFYSRRSPLIIAETGELKSMIVASRGVAPERIEVVGLGVNHELFRPLDQAKSREQLGIQSGAFVMLYVGGMDTYHDVGPAIDALTNIAVPALELHLVGDGEYRSVYESRAKRARVPIRFHGQVPHHKIPGFIAAADLCLAPYQVSAFPNQTVAFSTLKIPEYMACGRPVASVPSGHIKTLIEDQVSGFLFPNDVQSWLAFLEQPPDREKLKAMGRAAIRAAEPITWKKTARRYLDVCEKLMRQQGAWSTEQGARRMEQGT
jgi:glycosyltransferase involved in cell wall biosynthesis